MKTRTIISIVASLILGLGGCHSNHSDYCTVKGTVKGLKDGTKLELQDAFNHFKIVGTGVVKEGAFVVYPNVSSPTHVYLFTRDGNQLKDFILEPGTIVVEVNATNEEDYATGAKGTLSNDVDYRYITLFHSGNLAAAQAIMDSVLGTTQAGALALDMVDDPNVSSMQALGVLDRLTPELASLPYVAELREELTRRMKTEPAPEGGEAHRFIDMTYPDADGNPVSLSSVVSNPANRYVLLDFWATWCDPCVASLPQLKEVYAKYHEKGLEIFSVSEDPNVKHWKAFIKENGMTWVNVCDDRPSRKNSKAWHDYALPGIPTTLLIDCPSGAIIARENSDWDAFLGKLIQ